MAASGARLAQLAMMGPLHGVRVLALAGMGPLPVASMFLADMGASVVRIVRPQHGTADASEPHSGLDPRHDLVNRGVDTVVLDLKRRDDLDKALELAERADIFMEGYRPGVAEHLGLGPEDVLRSNPAVVYARLTGWGQDGPLAQRAGHDINYVALSGALHAMARTGEAPRPPINLLGDYAGGAAVAAFGIVCAYVEAKRSGRGQVVDAAMVDGVALLTAKIQGLRADGLFSDEPGTNWIDSGAPCYDTYRCADGRYLAVGALEKAFYEQFVSRLGIDVKDLPDRTDRSQWPRLRTIIAAAIAARTQDEWVQVYDGTDACVTPVLTFDEAAEHPQNAARRVFQIHDGALHPSPAPRLSRTPARSVSTPRRGFADVDMVVDSWRSDDNRR